MRLALLSVIALLFSATHVALADAPQPRTISTMGEAVVFVTPDEAVASFGVETFDVNLDKAKADNDLRSASLVKAIKAVGVEEKCIQTDNLQIEVRYKENTPTDGIIGYIARRSYSVTLKDIKLLEKLVDAALKNGANTMSGIDLRSVELRKHRDEARSMAAKAAKEKAQRLAADLESAVGKPLSITEGSSSFWGGYNARFAGAQVQNAVQVGGGDDPEGGVIPVGQIAIRAQVSVTFELTNAPGK